MYQIKNIQCDKNKNKYFSWVKKIGNIYYICICISKRNIKKLFLKLKKYFFKTKLFLPFSNKTKLFLNWRQDQKSKSKMKYFSKEKLYLNCKQKTKIVDFIQKCDFVVLLFGSKTHKGLNFWIKKPLIS